MKIEIKDQFTWVPTVHNVKTTISTIYCSYPALTHTIKLKLNLIKHRSNMVAFESMLVVHFDSKLNTVEN